MHGVTALITGPTGGIGRELAKELGRRGATGANFHVLATTHAQFVLVNPVLHHTIWQLRLRPLQTANTVCSAVILACRDITRGAAVAREVEAAQQAAGHARAARVEHLDLNDIASVRKCAQRIKAAGEPLHVLINNAGVYHLDGVSACVHYMQPAQTSANCGCVDNLIYVKCVHP